MRRLLSLVFVLVLVMASCGGSDDSSSSEETTTTTAAAAETTAAATETTAATTTTTAEETTTTAEETTTTTMAALSGPLADALTTASETPSGRIEGTMTMSGLDPTNPTAEFTIEFSGEFDNESGNSSFTMDMSSMAAAMGGGEDVGDLGDMFGEMEVRTVDGVTYIRFPLFAMLGVSTDWVSVPADETGTATSTFGAGPTNPMDFMEAWKDAGADVETVGSETIRGVNTTHYHATMDVEAMMDAASPEAADELQSLGGSGEMPVDFWIGDDGLVYRIVMEATEPTDTGTGTGTVTITWDMYDYGADITIEVPPADQVTDGTDLGIFTGESMMTP